MDTILFAAELALPAFACGMTITILMLCGGKKAESSTKAAPGAQPPAGNAYVSRPCNKRDGLAMDDPDLKSDKLTPTDGAKKEATPEQPKTAANTAVPKSDKPKTDGAAAEPKKAA